MSWTDERVALLRKMWGEGKTAAEIAKELGGVTRNAVIGKAHRLKLSNRISPIQQNNKKPARPVADEKPAVKVQAAALRPAKVVKSIGIKMVDLREKMCRWPIGDPRDADFLFCGCESAAGLVYCEEHARIAYQVASRSRALQPEDIERYEASAAAAEDAKEASAA